MSTSALVVFAPAPVAVQARRLCTNRRAVWIANRADATIIASAATAIATQ